MCLALTDSDFNPHHDFERNGKPSFCRHSTWWCVRFSRAMGRAGLRYLPGTCLAQILSGHVCPAKVDGSWASFWRGESLERVDRKHAVDKSSPARSRRARLAVCGRSCFIHKSPIDFHFLAGPSLSRSTPPWRGCLGGDTSTNRNI